MRILPLLVHDLGVVWCYLQLPHFYVNIVVGFMKYGMYCVKSQLSSDWLNTISYCSSAKRRFGCVRDMAVSGISLGKSTTSLET